LKRIPLDNAERSKRGPRRNPGRILVLRAGAIGDTVLCFPVLHALKRTAPGAELVFAGRTEARFLALESGLADEVLDLGSVRFTPLFAPSRSGAEASEAADFLSSFDLVVSLISDPEGAFAERLVFRGARDVLSLGRLPPGEWTARALFRVIEPVSAFPFRGDLALIRSGRPLPFETGGRFAVIHVGSGSRKKNWPPGRFCALVKAAAASGYRVFLPEGEADGEAVAGVLSEAGPAAEVVRLNLPELAALISRAAFFVGNDSGITHVAGQLGVPTVAIFGPSDPAVWKPLGPRVRVVAGRNGNFPSAGEVLESGGLGEFLENR